MSLTSILKRETDRKNLKNWFKHHFPKPDFPKAPAMLVSSGADVTYSAEVGTAFDYLFRFKLEYLNGDKCETRPWIADGGLRDIFQFVKAAKGKKIRVGYTRLVFVDKNKLKESVSERFANAKQCYEDFKKTGLLTEDLVRASVFLARLDSVSRAGIIPSNFEVVPDSEVAELMALLEVVPWSSFKVTQVCLLNPMFNVNLPLLGGADADLIIDDKLIDIKTAKHFNLERIDLNQILGYFLLAILDGKGAGLNAIGIYFARFGFLWTVPLNTFYDMSVYPTLAKQFSQLVVDTDLNLVDGDKLREEQDISRISWDFLDA